MTQGPEQIVWGDREVPLDAATDVQLGSLSLTIERSEFDYTVDYRYAQDRFVVRSTDVNSRIRVAIRNGPNDVLIEPVPADRTVVARPIHQLVIPRDSTADLFVSSPIWLRVSVDNIAIVDIPTEILSDTWIGTNTRTGQLAYANQTEARMRLSYLPTRPHRMVTPLAIENRGSNEVSVTRIGIPIPRLAVYLDRKNRLWSSALRIICDEGLETANVEIEEEFPVETEVRPIGSPRETEQRGFSDAIGMLLGS